MKLDCKNPAMLSAGPIAPIGTQWYAFFLRFSLNILGAVVIYKKFQQFYNGTSYTGTAPVSL
jgi:hypothetical protein